MKGQMQKFDLHQSRDLNMPGLTPDLYPFVARKPPFQRSRFQPCHRGSGVNLKAWDA
jgi:hypothetical protein